MVSLLIVLGGQGGEGAAIAVTAALVASRGTAIVGARVVLRRAEAGRPDASRYVVSRREILR